MFKLIDRRSFLKLSGFAAIVSSSSAFAAEPSMLARATERSLSFYNLHTSENLKTTYWAEGDYIPDSLGAINYHLRDYRTGEVRDIDRRLLDALCELRLRLDTSDHFELISGYRSAATNAMLHSQSDGVAAHSLHIEGMAADIRLPRRSLALVRKAAISMKAGGVGYYPASQFVHVDVGRVRTW